MFCASWDETGPLTLIEAMALGKAILSTKVGLVGENLIAEEEALFVEPGDAVGLAAAIQRLVRDPKLLGKLATNARNAYDQYLVSIVLEKDSSRCWRKRLSLTSHGVKGMTPIAIFSGATQRASFPGMGIKTREVSWSVAGQPSVFKTE